MCFESDRPVHQGNELACCSSVLMTHMSHLRKPDRCNAAHWVRCARWDLKAVSVLWIECGEDTHSPYTLCVSEICCLYLLPKTMSYQNSYSRDMTASLGPGTVMGRCCTGRKPVDTGPKLRGL